MEKKNYQGLNRNRILLFDIYIYNDSKFKWGLTLVVLHSSVRTHSNFESLFSSATEGQQLTTTLYLLFAIQTHS